MKSIDKSYSSSNRLVNLLDEYMEGEELKILDIGSGQGVDSIYFVKRGHKVVSIEMDTNTIERRRDCLPGKEAKKLQIIQGDYTDIELPKADVILGYYSLPFCLPKNFDRMWTNLTNSLDKDGLMGIVLLTEENIKDIECEGLTIHNQSDIEELFKEFEILHIEKTKESKTIIDEYKNKNIVELDIYNIIGRKL